MEVSELMVGDCVCYNKPNGYVTQVDGIRHCGNETLGYEYFIDCVRDKIDPLYIELPKDSFNIEILHPIPLTKEILEKNGFKRTFDEDLILYVHSNPCITIEVGDNYKEYKHKGFYVKGILHRFYYVHELQHALRLCGIDKEIIV